MAEQVPQPLSEPKPESPRDRIMRLVEKDSSVYTLETLKRAVSGVSGDFVARIVGELVFDGVLEYKEADTLRDRRLKVSDLYLMRDNSRFDKDKPNH